MASPYSAALPAPMPGTSSSCAVDCGRAAAIAISVRSCRMMNGAIARRRASARRHSRSAATVASSAGLDVGAAAGFSPIKGLAARSSRRRFVRPRRATVCVNEYAAEVPYGVVEIAD